MPELPEVETTKNGLLPHIKNKKVTAVNILFPTLRFQIPPHLKTSLVNKKLIDLKRRGKYLIFQFKNGDLIVHLGMSGKIKISKLIKYEKHDHFELIFNDITLRLNDPRRFGCVLWADNYNNHRLIKNLGVEPLSTLFDENYLFIKSDNKKTNIKSFIMNSNILVGVGNIYACESLFLAKINPLLSVNKVSKKQFKLLTKAIKTILKNAIKKGGTTLKDFANVDGELGYFSQELQVYNLENKKCNNCNNKILRIVQNQRATFYCKNCQN
jgi:formamidopyrimidine-DNA glycosylase